jgi:hypothetical protein
VKRKVYIARAIGKSGNGDRLSTICFFDPEARRQSRDTPDIREEDLFGFRKMDLNVHASRS